MSRTITQNDQEFVPQGIHCTRKLREVLTAILRQDARRESELEFWDGATNHENNGIQLNIKGDSSRSLE